MLALYEWYEEVCENGLIYSGLAQLLIPLLFWLGAFLNAEVRVHAYTQTMVAIIGKRILCRISVVLI